MVKLKDVIASVLRDVIEAQHEANLLTEALSEEYGKDGLPRHLLVPTVNIGEMEITLKYAIINDNDDDDDSETSYENENVDENRTSYEGKSDGDGNGEALEELEVIVDAKRLAELGPECIHTISFKVGTHNDND